MNVDKALCAERKRKLCRNINNLVNHAVEYIIGRINCDRVARVDACTLDMLHNAGNKNILAVGDNVNLKLRTHHVLIYKNGIFNLLRKNDIHVTLNIGVVICDSHVLTADNV